MTDQNNRDYQGGGDRSPPAPISPQEMRERTIAALLRIAEGHDHGGSNDYPSYNPKFDSRISAARELREWYKLETGYVPREREQ